MSISFPTVVQRKDSSPHPKGKLGSQKGRKGHKGPILLVMCLIVFVGLAYIALGIRPGGVKMTELLVIQEGEFLGVHGQGFLVSWNNEVQYVCLDGRHFTLPGLYHDIVFSGPWLFDVNPSSFSFSSPKTGFTNPLTLPLAKGEMPLPFLHGDAVMTCRPRQASCFGEPWCLCAFSDEGILLWEKQVAYAPFTALCDETRLIIGALDISGGGAAWVICLSRATGQVLWQSVLGKGNWRYLGFALNEKLWAVLDSGAYGLAANGQVDWQYLPRGKIHCAAALSGALSLSLSNPVNPTIAKALGKAQVITFGAGGEELWRKKFMKGAPQLSSWSEHLFVLERDRVSCFQLEAKEALLSLKLDGCPIGCVKDVILIDKGPGLVVAKIEIPSSAR